jgi:hypothetical protein
MKNIFNQVQINVLIVDFNDIDSQYFSSCLVSISQAIRNDFLYSQMAFYPTIGELNNPNFIYLNTTFLIPIHFHLFWPSVWQKKSIYTAYRRGELS